MVVNYNGNIKFTWFLITATIKLLLTMWIQNVMLAIYVFTFSDNSEETVKNVFNVDACIIESNV